MPHSRVVMVNSHDFVVDAEIDGVADAILGPQNPNPPGPVAIIDTKASAKFGPQRRVFAMRQNIAYVEEYADKVPLAPGDPGEFLDVLPDRLRSEVEQALRGGAQSSK